MYKEEKGITLIALIVTIIVLIILAAVTIVALTGDNNILDDAQLAKVSNAYRGAEDQIKLAYMAVYSQIQVQTALNSNYDATEGTNAIKLAEIVKKDLAGTPFKFALDKTTTTDTDGNTVTIVSAIYVECTDGAIQAGKIDTDIPKYDGVVYTKISLEKQKVSYEFDVAKPTESTVTAFSATLPTL